MGTTTTPEVWPTDKPFVVYIAPAEYPERYSALMYHMSQGVQKDLGWEDGTIETLGLIAPTPKHVLEGLHMFGEYGFNPRLVTLVVMWGDTADAIGFDGEVPVECGYGFAVIYQSGVVLPVLRMPDITGGWWIDPLHQSYAEVTYAEMIRQGRVRRTESDYTTTIQVPSMWN